MSIIFFPLRTPDADHACNRGHECWGTGTCPLLAPAPPPAATSALVGGTEEWGMHPGSLVRSMGWKRVSCALEPAEQRLDQKMSRAEGAKGGQVSRRYQWSLQQIPSHLAILNPQKIG